VTHEERPYLLANVADARGGVDSGENGNLGLHLMNDPSFEPSADFEESDSRPNIRIDTDGRAFALRRIYRGEELFVTYNN
jgi:hypothetical protein